MSRTRKLILTLDTGTNVNEVIEKFNSGSEVEITLNFDDTEENRKSLCDLIKMNPFENDSYKDWEDYLDKLPDNLEVNELVKVLEEVFILRCGPAERKPLEERCLTTKEQILTGFLQGYFFDSENLKEEITWMIRTKWNILKKTTNFIDFFEKLFEVSCFSSKNTSLN
jgi:hypothetical protein